MKRNILIIVSVALLAVLVSIFGAEQNREQREKISIVASFYPLGHFAEEVGGDTVEVTVITPPGVEAHDFEPSPQDITRITESDIFIYNGGGFDPWAEKLAETMRGSATIMVNMGRDLAGAEENLVSSNPHFWLDPLLAAREVEIIRDALSQKNPFRADTYGANAAAYNEKLSGLHREYEHGLAACALRSIIVSHEAFEYLGKRYTIEINSIAGVSPDEEPSPRKLGELATLAREKGIKYIFFETTVSPRLAETIAQEVGAETLVLNPIETLTIEEQKAGEDYIGVMQKNLNNLKRALRCI